MVRIVSSYPARAAGIGLLLLRASIAASMFLSVPETLLAKAPNLVWMSELSLALTVSLGVLTPITCLFCCVFEIVLLKAGGPGNSFAVVAILNAIGVALLGPGAYSLDARWFGRRAVIFPRSGLQ